MNVDGTTPALGSYLLRTPDGEVLVEVSIDGTFSRVGISPGSYEAIGPDGQLKTVRVLGEEASQNAAPADLAFTGSSTEAPVRTALTLVGLGVVVVVFARRRRRLGGPDASTFNDDAGQ